MNSDERLMSQFYAGQDNAFDRLCDAHRHGLVADAFYRLPRQVPGRRQRAEDLAQEALFCVFNTRRGATSRWNGSKGSVKTWLHAILKYRIFSFLRTKRGKERLDTDLASAEEAGWLKVAESETAGSNSEPWRAIAVQEDHDRLDRAINQLSAADRKLVHHKFVLGKTQTEIAHELGTSNPTISRRVDQALRALRAAVVDKTSRRPARLAKGATPGCGLMGRLPGSLRPPAPFSAVRSGAAIVFRESRGQSSSG